MAYFRISHLLCFLKWFRQKKTRPNVLVVREPDGADMFTGVDGSNPVDHVQDQVEINVLPLQHSTSMITSPEHADVVETDSAPLPGSQEQQELEPTSGIQQVRDTRSAAGKRGAALQMLLRQLEKKGAKAKVIKQTRHRSLIGHIHAINVFCNELGMELISHEEQLSIPKHGLKQPDIIFKWVRPGALHDEEAIVVCEVKQHPPHNRHNQSRENYLSARAAKRRDLAAQVHDRYKALGHDGCCYLGLFLEGGLRKVTQCHGEYRSVLLDELRLLDESHNVIVDV